MMGENTNSSWNRSVSISLTIAAILSVSASVVMVCPLGLSCFGLPYCLLFKHSQLVTDVTQFSRKSSISPQYLGSIGFDKPQNRELLRNVS